ncbi:MAG: ChaN family lipoprotein [Flavobacteriales bacterium]|nr:ChaN family lipoprotein [Flavobacteriales bacterium]
MRLFGLIGCLFVLFSASAQDAAYKIYTGKGKKSNFKKMTKQIWDSDVVFFGELHDNPIAHWMEYEIGLYLIEHGEKITFGAEMFERDEQVYLDQYLKGEISAEQFDSLAGLWNNFFTDYLPVVDLAKEYGVEFIATNITRKYASQVYKQGLESLEALPEDEKKDIAPLPIPFDINVPCYQTMLEMMGGHGGENFPKAQAIKDATMADAIVKNFTSGEGNIFYHLNGSFHSDNKEGIGWYINQYAPDLRIFNIAVVLQSDVDQLEEEYLVIADFIIVVDEDMTSTY